MMWSSCYNQVALSGGPRDELPPKLDTTKSTDNFQIQFAKQPILLEFDEYIDLRDANTQIVISPPLNEPPRVSNRLKKIQFDFNEEEVLKENVTYVINFGKSIRDYTEGNELLNFTFVFSTGDYIDSLSLKGSVVDARTREPKEDALVLLYIDYQDSIVYQQRPFYFARTDKEGRFQIENLRSDTFKVVTLIDQNLNYLYDPNADEIGFLDSLIILTDTLAPELNLSIFKESTQPRYRSFEIIAQGRIRVDFEGRTFPEAITLLDTIRHFVQHEEGQSFLTLWYHPFNRKGVSYEILREDITDTITARINLRSVDTLDNRISISSTNIDDPQIGLHPLDSLEFTFDRPLASFDVSLIQVVDTISQDTLDIELDSALNSFPSMSLNLHHEWPQERVLAVTFYPGSVTDLFGKSIDTTIQYVRIAQEVDFGKMILRPLDFGQGQFVFQLMRDDKVERTHIILGSEEPEIVFERLIPGTYSLQIIDDEVPNGRWDPGNYLEKRQSEAIYNLTLPDLRPNWLLEEEIRYDELLVTPIPDNSGSEER